PISTLFPYTTLFRSGARIARTSYAPPGLAVALQSTHGLRRGLSSFAATRLCATGNLLPVLLCCLLLISADAPATPANYHQDFQRSEEHTSELQSLAY